MPHDPRSNMSIDPELNAGYPFELVGLLYQQSVTEQWSADRFCAEYSALVVPVQDRVQLAPASGGKVTALSAKPTENKAAVSAGRRWGKSALAKQLADRLVDIQLEAAIAEDYDDSEQYAE